MVRHELACSSTERERGSILYDCVFIIRSKEEAEQGGRLFQMSVSRQPCFPVGFLLSPHRYWVPDPHQDQELLKGKDLISFLFILMVRASVLRAFPFPSPSHLTLTRFLRSVLLFLLSSGGI